MIAWRRLRRCGKSAVGSGTTLSSPCLSIQGATERVSLTCTRSTIGQSCSLWSLACLCEKKEMNSKLHTPRERRRRLKSFFEAQQQQALAQKIPASGKKLAVVDCPTCVLPGFTHRKAKAWGALGTIWLLVAGGRPSLCVNGTTKTESFFKIVAPLWLTLRFLCRFVVWLKASATLGHHLNFSRRQSAWSLFLFCFLRELLSGFN